VKGKYGEPAAWDGFSTLFVRVTRHRDHPFRAILIARFAAS
jgi:hypothetical protein